VAAARAAKPPPFIIAVMPTADGHAVPAGTSAVDGIVVKPASPQAAKAMINRCVRVRLKNRVLVVDDSSTMRGIVRKILSASRFNLEIAEAHEGIEALKQIGSGRFDVAIVDYNMPGLNGVETVSEIKRQHPRLGVVLMTSTPDDTIVEKARDAGAEAVLKKPFYASDIDAVLYSVFGLRAPAR
jgi:CheY-like chemotaxis protein